MRTKEKIRQQRRIKRRLEGENEGKAQCGQ